MFKRVLLTSINASFGFFDIKFKLQPKHEVGKKKIKINMNKLPTAKYIALILT